MAATASVRGKVGGATGSAALFSRGPSRRRRSRQGELSKVPKHIESIRELRRWRTALEASGDLAYELLISQFQQRVARQLVHFHHGEKSPLGLFWVIYIQ